MCVMKLMLHRRLARRPVVIFAWWLRATMMTVLVTLALPAVAAHVELQGGRSYMDGYGSNALFVEGVFADHRIGDSRFSWSPDVSLGWIDGRDVARFDVTRPGTRNSVTLLAAGVRLHYGDAGDWYRPLFVSFQPALQLGRTLALSSSYEFVSTLGWQARHFSIQLRHVSNGGLDGSNRGETMALVGVGFEL